MKALDALVDLLERRRPSGTRVRDWRLSWSARASSRAGVKDSVRAGVHAPLTVGRGFVLEYLFQWEDGRISSGAAEKVGIVDPERFLQLARETAFDDPEGANFQGPVAMPETPLLSEEAAEEARSGGARLFAPLFEIAAERAEAWSFKTWSGSVSAAVGEAGILTSQGLSARSNSTQTAYSFWYEGRTGDSHQSRSLILPSEAAERIERSCDLVSRLGNPDPSFEPGTMPVLLHPEVVESLLSHYVLSNLHGERIYHRQGAFGIEKFGAPERVFAPSLSLRLDPSVPMDTGSFIFTTEGVPARPLDYIAEGRLVSPITDLKYARRLKREPAPGPASADSLRLTGAAPVGRDEALLRIGRTGRGVLVLSLLGLHTQDSTRGDFSVSAPQTLTIRGGTLGGAVKAVLTGSFFEILRDPNLALVAFPGFRTPGLLFEGSVGIDNAA